MVFYFKKFKIQKLNNFIDKLKSIILIKMSQITVRPQQTQYYANGPYLFNTDYYYGHRKLKKQTRSRSRSKSKNKNKKSKSKIKRY